MKSQVLKYSTPYSLCASAPGAWDNSSRIYATPKFNLFPFTGKEIY